MRIAQVVGNMNGGGVEAVVMNYYRHIDRKQVQFDFFINSDSTLVPRDEIAELGGRIYEVPPYKHVMAFTQELKGLFSSGEWEIVHSHINSLSVFPLHSAKMAGVPIRIAHCHSTGGYQGELVRNAAKSILKRFSNTYATHRFACSQFAGEWLFGKQVSFEVINNAVELERFSFDEEVRNRMRTEMHLSNGQFVVGHVGRFMTQKNHLFLLQVFAKLCELRNDALLLFVGEGELKQQIEESAKSMGLLPKVKFLGQRQDVDNLYQVFDAFVLPSLYEGLALVAIEAQRAGLPCLLANTITREACLTNNVSFLPLDDPAIWAKALNELALVLSNNGMNRYINGDCFIGYDIEEAAPKLQRLYQSYIK